MDGREGELRGDLRPGAFATLSPQLKQRYADALGVAADRLDRLP